MTRIGLTLDEHFDLCVKPPAGADPALHEAAQDERDRMFPMATPAARPRPARSARRGGRRRMGPETRRNGETVRSGPKHGTPKISGTCGLFPQVPEIRKNGAGGNRTPVPRRSACSLYACSLWLIFE